MNTIGKRLAAIREKLGLSLDTVHKKINVNKSNLSKIENDKQFPSTQTLIELSKLYGVTTDWILFGDKNSERNENSSNESEKLFYASVLLAYFNKVNKLWSDGDRDTRGWIKVQLKTAFSAIAEEIKKENEEEVVERDVNLTRKKRD